MICLRPMTTELDSGSKARRALRDLSGMHSSLLQVFDDLSNFERFWKPAPARWSCAQVAGHLVDAEIAFAFRIRTALAEPGKTLDPFDPDLWVAAQRWNELPVDDTLHTFSALRQATVVLLGPLVEDEWQRHYVHSVRGVQTIADTALFLATHDARHLVQLGRTAEEARAASKRGSRALPRPGLET